MIEPLSYSERSLLSLIQGCYLKISSNNVGGTQIYQRVKFMYCFRTDSVRVQRGRAYLNGKQLSIVAVVKIWALHKCIIKIYRGNTLFRIVQLQDQAVPVIVLGKPTFWIPWPTQTKCVGRTYQPELSARWQGCSQDALRTRTPST